MNRTAENDQKGREFSLAMRDDIVASIWQGRPGMWGDALTHFAMADRAEELGLLCIAAAWRAGGEVM